jgi:hypothetical protein
MADLDAQRSNGWSYAVGWSQDIRMYLARAWKTRRKPLRTPHGVILVMHTVSASADDFEAAAFECSKMARHRNANEDEGLSEYERSYAEYVQRASR